MATIHKNVTKERIVLHVQYEKKEETDSFKLIDIALIADTFNGGPAFGTPPEKTDDASC